MSIFKKIVCDCNNVFVVEVSWENEELMIYKKLEEVETESPVKIENKFPNKFRHGAQAKKPIQRKCKNCGTLGHRRESCPNISVDPDEESSDTLEESPQISIPSITRGQFEGIKKLQEMDYNTKDAASTSKVPLVVANRIFQSSDFEYYVDHFQQ